MSSLFNQISQRLFLVIAFVFASPAHAGINGFYRDVLPKYFYHWIDVDSLSQKWRLKALKETGEIPLPNMKPEFLIADAIPELAGKGGLFVWHHPVSGMGTGPSEMYGNSVIMLETQRQPARILDVSTSPGETISKLTNLRNADVLRHTRVRDGVVLWEEWIILKPKVITQFTADPKIIKPRMRVQYNNLVNGGEIAERWLHFKIRGSGQDAKTKPLFQSRRDLKKLVLPVLKRYIEMDAEAIPEVWRRPMDYGACEALSEDLF